MTELPPIIERLDALYLETTDGPWEFIEDIGELEGPTRSFTCDCGVAAEDQRWIAASRTLYYPLRAELLRLQEERDEGAAEARRKAGECNDARDRHLRAVSQRDALLEALKGSVEAMEYELEHTCDDDGPDDPCLGIAGLLEALDNARPVIANVEGKE